MKGNKIIGFLSLLLTIPSVLILIGLLCFLGFPYLHWTVIERATIIICGNLGGFALIINKKFGYIFTGVASTVASVSALQSLTFLVLQMNMPKMGIAQSVYELAIVITITILWWKNWRKRKE